MHQSTSTRQPSLSEAFHTERRNDAYTLGTSSPDYTQSTRQSLPMRSFQDSHTFLDVLVARSFKQMAVGALPKA